jgi:hypothetical protein
MDLAELRNRCYIALERNRNYRQANALLVHHASLLRGTAMAAQARNIQKHLTLCCTSRARIYNSVSLLARTEGCAGVVEPGAISFLLSRRNKFRASRLND